MMDRLETLRNDQHAQPCRCCHRPTWCLDRCVRCWTCPPEGHHDEGGEA
jgi:hypothetical protein